MPNLGDFITRFRKLIVRTTLLFTTNFNNTQADADTLIRYFNNENYKRKKIFFNKFEMFQLTEKMACFHKRKLFFGQVFATFPTTTSTSSTGSTSFIRSTSSIASASFVLIFVTYTFDFSP